jgi:hypothetical protein
MVVVLLPQMLLRSWRGHKLAPWHKEFQMAGFTDRHARHLLNVFENLKPPLNHGEMSLAQFIGLF